MSSPRSSRKYPPRPSAARSTASADLPTRPRLFAESCSSVLRDIPVPLSLGPRKGCQTTVQRNRWHYKGIQLGGVHHPYDGRENWEAPVVWTTSPVERLRQRHRPQARVLGVVEIGIVGTVEFPVVLNPVLLDVLSLSRLLPLQHMPYDILAAVVPAPLRQGVRDSLGPLRMSRVENRRIENLERTTSSPILLDESPTESSDSNRGRLAWWQRFSSAETRPPSRSQGLVDLPLIFDRPAQRVRPDGRNLRWEAGRISPDRRVILGSRTARSAILTVRP